jgi:hypothetical protein
MLPQLGGDVDPSSAAVAELAKALSGEVEGIAGSTHSPAPNLWVAARMKAGDHVDGIANEAEEQGVREYMEECTANVTNRHRKLRRIGSYAPNRAVEPRTKPGAQTWS